MRSRPYGLRSVRTRLALSAIVVGFAMVAPMVGASAQNGPSAPGSPDAAGIFTPLAPTGEAPAALRLISFPVLGPVVYRDDWGECRDGCRRLHQGQDIFGERMQPIVSPVNGTIVQVLNDSGRSGNGLKITDAEGWSYNFFHINNDPLTESSLGSAAADAAARERWRWPAGMTLGATVSAGQVIGWMGDSGNAETSEVHLHFEIRDPQNKPVNPYTSLRAGEFIDRCRPAPVRALPVTSPPHVVEGTIYSFPTRTGQGRFTISTTGAVLAEGDATWIGDQRRPAEPCDTPLPIVNARNFPLPPLPEDPSLTTTAPTTPIGPTTTAAPAASTDPATTVPAEPSVDTTTPGTVILPAEPLTTTSSAPVTTPASNPTSTDTSTTVPSAARSTPRPRPRRRSNRFAPSQPGLVRTAPRHHAWGARRVGSR
jgi:hypothetical protein